MTTWIHDPRIISIGLVIVSRPGVGVVTTQTRTSIGIDHPRIRATLQKTRHAAGIIESGPSQTQQRVGLRNSTLPDCLCPPSGYCLGRLIVNGSKRGNSMFSAHITFVTRLHLRVACKGRPKEILCAHSVLSLLSGMVYPS